MPRGDGTGPMGAGPLTGRGAGLCADYTAPGYANPVGRGVGFGGGRGFRRNCYATGLPFKARFGYPAYCGMSEEAVGEKEFLSRQAKILEIRLEEVKKRLTSLEKDAE